MNNNILIFVDVEVNRNDLIVLFESLGVEFEPKLKIGGFIIQEEDFNLVRLSDSNFVFYKVDTLSKTFIAGRRYVR